MCDAPADWVLKDAWAESIRQQGIPLAVWPDVEDYGAIEMFIGWRYPEGIFSKVCSASDGSGKAWRMHCESHMASFHRSLP